MFNLGGNCRIITEFCVDSPCNFSRIKKTGGKIRTFELGGEKCVSITIDCKLQQLPEKLGILYSFICDVFKIQQESVESSLGLSDNLIQYFCLFDRLTETLSNSNQKKNPNFKFDVLISKATFKIDRHVDFDFSSLNLLEHEIKSKGCYSEISISCFPTFVEYISLLVLLSSGVASLDYLFKTGQSFLKSIVNIVKKIFGSKSTKSE